MEKLPQVRMKLAMYRHRTGRLYSPGEVEYAQVSMLPNHYEDFCKGMTPLYEIIEGFEFLNVEQ